MSPDHHYDVIIIGTGAGGGTLAHTPSVKTPAGFVTMLDSSQERVFADP